MWGIGNTLFNAVLEAAAGMAVSSVVSILIEWRKNGSKRQLEAGAEMAASTSEMQEGPDVTLYSLQQELMKIRCAINVARGRRITDQELLEWLAHIINASYIGNYYHRTFKHHRNSLSLMIESELTNNLVISPSYRAAKRQRTNISLLPSDKEPMKLHIVLKMLKSIDVHAFLLMVNVQPERSMKTYLYMDHNILLNRDKEKQLVMNFLFEPSRAGENNVDILPIVGSAGGGKTSLALHCFDDPKVQHHFSLKLYIRSTHISYLNLDIPVVLREIIQKFYSTYGTRHNDDNYFDIDENTLLAMVKQILSSERFLLMLDHISMLDPVVWNVLWDSLSCGEKGSKVILISSIHNYEKYKKTINCEAAKPVMVDGFSEDDYMSFFEEHAFGGGEPEDYPELATIGREIGKKMNGSIWGAIILGELLRDNLNASFWSKFLQGGLLSPLERGKHIKQVMDTMCLLLPKKLEVRGYMWGFNPGNDSPCYDDLRTFRELMLLDPNLIDEENTVQFLVTKHVFLNRCTVCTATGRKQDSSPC